MQETAQMRAVRRTAVAVVVGLLALSAGCREPAESVPQSSEARSTAVPSPAPGADGAATASPAGLDRGAAVDRNRDDSGAALAETRGRSATADRSSESGDDRSLRPGPSKQHPSFAKPQPEESDRSSAFRLPDDRPPVNETALQAHGIRVLRSRHLVLLTDVATDDVELIPPLADALFAVLEHETGSLAPAPDGGTFQVTGCLIDAEKRFAAAGLMPPEAFTIRHGRHLGYRFWMYNPTTDYYRRHLALHEFVHCFMMCEHGMRNIPPLWYTEGIAEYFATHAAPGGRARDASQPAAVQFGILPASTGALPGWGRVSEIRRQFESGPASEFHDCGLPSLQQIFRGRDSGFRDEQYAFAWAVCWLVRNHPELREDFGSLLTARSGGEFRQRFRDLPQSVLDRAGAVWLPFADALIEGFDTQRAFPGAATVLESASPDSVQIALAADRGWQHVPLSLQTGDICRIRCGGRYQMHDQPQPWMSEPQGITIDYVRGRPLGEVVALLVTADQQTAGQRIPIGVAAELAVPHDAELWLQINDSAASRADNAGSATVTVARRRP